MIQPSASSGWVFSSPASLSTIASICCGVTDCCGAAASWTGSSACGLPRNPYSAAAAAGSATPTTMAATREREGCAEVSPSGASSAARRGPLLTAQAPRAQLGVEIGELLRVYGLVARERAFRPRPRAPEERRQQQCQRGGGEQAAKNQEKDHGDCGGSPRISRARARCAASSPPPASCCLRRRLRYSARKPNAAASRTNGPSQSSSVVALNGGR